MKYSLLLSMLTLSLLCTVPDAHAVYPPTPWPAGQEIICAILSKPEWKVLAHGLVLAGGAGFKAGGMMLEGTNADPADAFFFKITMAGAVVNLALLSVGIPLYISSLL